MPSSPQRHRRVQRRVPAFLLIPSVLLGLSACAEAPVANAGGSVGGRILLAAAQSTVRSDADPSAGSPFGSYLAGLHAGNARDLSAAADFMLHALSYDPVDPQLLNRTLLLLAGDGRFDEAAAIARRVQAVTPGNSLAGLILAVEAARADGFAEADELLANLPDRGLSEITGALMKAWLRVAQNDIQGAASRMGPLRNKNGFGVLYGMHMGLMRDMLGDTAGARKDFELALESAAQPSLRLVWLAGNFFERAGDPARAIALYEAFLKSNPGSSVVAPALERARAGQVPAPVLGDAKQGMAEALFNLASLLSQERAEDVALVHVHLALRLQRDFGIAQVLLGEVLQAQDRGTAAIEVYRGISQDSPFSLMVRLRVAEELERLDKIDEAVAELETIAEDEPQRAEPLIRLGNLMRNKERFAEAIAAYDRAVERIGAPERRYWTLYYFRGIALERESEWTRAEADFLQALELEPEQPFVLNYLAYSWVELKRNLDQAKGMLVRAVELRPDDGFIVDSLGWAYFQLGDFELGVKYLERAVELRPQDPIINDHLGDAYWRVGRKHEARFQWRRALSLKPEAKEVPAIESKIQQGLPDKPKDI